MLVACVMQWPDTLGGSEGVTVQFTAHTGRQII